MDNESNQQTFSRKADAQHVGQEISQVFIKIINAINSLERTMDARMTAFEQAMDARMTAFEQAQDARMTAVEDRLAAVEMDVNQGVEATSRQGASDSI
ncbi:hypothetical protein E4U54_001385 [Claviceps lovelessii]|nr:hypothetical protein E4U54_001385 [Claviceps lovelessii]